MKSIIINNNTYKLSGSSHDFLQKYLHNMKNFISENNIESDVYDDIEERISEKFDSSLKTKKNKELSNKIVIDIVNEIWEASEIFKDILADDIDYKAKPKKDFKEYFSNKNKTITRNSKKWIIAWVCYGIWKRFEIDPLWIRLAFVLGTFIWWVTIILYIALIILLPNESDSEKIIKQKKKLIKIKNIAKEWKTKIIWLKNNLKDSNKIIEEKIEYIKIKSPSFLKRLLGILKWIFLFFWFIIKISITSILITIFIPLIVSLLFVSWIFFTDLCFNNQDIFINMHLLLKVWLIWIIGSLSLLVFWIIWKIWKWKILSNILLLTWVLWFLCFIFIWSIWFFNTAQHYINTYSKTESLELDSKNISIKDIQSITESDYINNWINFIWDVDIKNYSWENIKIEITSVINSKNQQSANMVFEKLNPLSIIQDNSLILEIENNNIFNEIVPYSFLRRNIIFYIPKWSSCKKDPRIFFDNYYEYLCDKINNSSFIK